MKQIKEIVATLKKYKADMIAEQGTENNAADMKVKYAKVNGISDALDIVGDITGLDVTLEGNQRKFYIVPVEGAEADIGGWSEDKKMVPVVFITDNKNIKRNDTFMYYKGKGVDLAKATGNATSVLENMPANAKISVVIGVLDLEEEEKMRTAFLDLLDAKIDTEMAIIEAHKKKRLLEEKKHYSEIFEKDPIAQTKFDKAYDNIGEI